MISVCLWVNHEFCHVHDDDEKFRVFGVTDLERAFSRTPDRVSPITYVHADIVSTRLSARSKPLLCGKFIKSNTEDQSTM